MVLASLLVPLAVLAIVLLIQRLHLPAFLAIMATVVVYGIAADMTFQSLGKAFGLGFTSALEQVGLLVVAAPGSPHWRCASRSAPARRRCRRACRTGRFGGGRPGAAAAGRPGAPRRALTGAHPAGGRRRGALRRSAVAAASVIGQLPDRPDGRAARRGDRALLGWWHVARQVPAGTVPGGSVGPDRHRHPDRAAGRAIGGADAERAPGQGRRARVLHRHLEAADPGGIALTVAMLFAGRWQPSVLANRGWAPPCWRSGVGRASVFDETGMAELLAEHALHPKSGILTPFLPRHRQDHAGQFADRRAHRLGMVEPMLRRSASTAPGPSLASAAVGAGSMAICHVNDPLFWIAARWPSFRPAARSSSSAGQRGDGSRRARRAGGDPAVHLGQVSHLFLIGFSPW